VKLKTNKIFIIGLRKIIRNQKNENQSGKKIINCKLGLKDEIKKNQNSTRGSKTKIINQKIKD
jgi:hypothetical protein